MIIRMVKNYVKAVNEKIIERNLESSYRVK